MGWSDEVHESRMAAELNLARAERRVRKRGFPVPVLETAEPSPFLALAVVASGLYAWQHFGPAVGSFMAQNPLFQSLKSLILSSGPSLQQRRAAASRGKPAKVTAVSAGKPPGTGGAAAASTSGRRAAVAAPSGVTSISPAGSAAEQVSHAHAYTGYVLHAHGR
jgi:hypothetical protein